MEKHSKRHSAPPPDAGPPESVFSAPAWPAWAAPLLVAAITFLFFSPSLGNDFVNWDDYSTLTENPHFRGLGFKQLSWMFTTFHLGHYIPLSWMSYGLDFTLWGMDPKGYHLTNLLLHCANAVLFYFFAGGLLRLALPEPTRESPGLTAGSAFVSTLFFALHPLRVQSVAWATERRDVLCAFFCIGSMLLYLNAQKTSPEDRAGRRLLAGAVAVFVLALLSKESAVWILPFLVVMDFYPLRRFADPLRPWSGPGARRAWLEKVPFAALVLLEAFVVAAAHKQAGVPTTLHMGDIGFTSRLMLFSFTVVNYLRMTLIPAGILPVHYIPADFDYHSAGFKLCAFAALLITTALIFLRRRWPALLAVWVCHAISYAPLLILLGPTAELTAGRYTYLPGLGFAVLAGAAFFHCWRLSSGRLKHAFQALAAALAVSATAGLASMTWRQTLLWRDSITMWTHTLRADEDNYLAHFKLGQAYHRLKDLPKAHEHFLRAITILPSLSLPYRSLADLYMETGRPAEAVPLYKKFLELSPGDEDAPNDVGNAFFQQGKLDEAALWYRRSLQMRPHQGLARLNLGNVLAMRGDFEGAAEEYRKAVSASPGSAEARNNLGVVLMKLGRIEEALARYQEAVGINPEYAEAFSNQCGALIKLGRAQEAVDNCAAALRYKPDFKKAQRRLRQAMALRDKSR